MIKTTFKKTYAAGVKIAFGTDSGVSPHGQNAREFELMVEGGMPPMKAIQSATLEASRLLRVEAVRGNPLENIHAMFDVVFVMKRATSKARDAVTLNSWIPRLTPIPGLAPLR